MAAATGLHPVIEEARSRADWYDELLDRGLLSAEWLEESELVTHERIDALFETMHILHPDDPLALQEGVVGGLMKWLEKLHPRDRGGKFAEKPGGSKVAKMVGPDAGRNQRIAKEVKARGIGPSGKKKEPIFKTAPTDAKRLATQQTEPADLRGIPEGMTAAQYRAEGGAKRTKGSVAKGLNQQELRQQAEELAGKARASRQKKLDKRVGKAAKRAGKNPTHWNANDRVSQRSLLDYVKRTLTTPSTMDAHSETQPDGTVRFHPDRKQLHDAIIDVLMRQRNEDRTLSATNAYHPSQDEPKVVFMGGGYAAGKSTMRKMLEARGADNGGLPDDHIVIDPDQIKAMLPEFAATATQDPEANLRVYEEAWHIAQELQARAVDAKMNVVVDGITNTSPEDVLGRVQNFKDRGYTSVKIAYADLPTDDALARSADRTKNAIERGDGPNMRHIPESVMRAVHRDVAATVPALMRDPRVKDLGLSIEVHDTRGPKGSLNQVATMGEDGSLEVHDRKLWQEFQDKQHENVEALGEKGPTIPEEIQAKLKHVQEVGLNDWATPEEGRPSGEIFKSLMDRGLTGTDLGTHMLHGDGQGNWEPSRIPVHNMVIEDAFTDQDGNSLVDFTYGPDGAITGVTPKLPLDDPPVMLFMGGGSASGKSTALGMEENKSVQPQNAVTLDPDHIKSLLPEYDQMVGERDKDGVPKDPDRFAASGVHEESSFLAKHVQKLAMEAGMNVVVDGTGDSKPGKFAGKMTDAVAAGYVVDSFYVNAPTDLAVISATERAELTGRWVPEPEIRNIHRNVSANLPDVLALVEDGTVRNMAVFDRSAGDMKRIAHVEDGQMIVDDPVAWDAMQAKKDE